MIHVKQLAVLTRHRARRSRLPLFLPVGRPGVASYRFKQPETKSMQPDAGALVCSS